MIIDKDNKFISQRTVPKMVLIQTSIEGELLVLSAPGTADLKVPVKAPLNKVPCKYDKKFCFFELRL